MTCREFLEIAPVYLSGELEGRELARVHGHLAECGSCAREMEREAELDRRMREEMSGELRDASAIQESVREQIGAEKARRWAIGAAAAAGILFTVVMGYRAMKPERVFADAAADHRAEVMEHKPRRWRNEPAEIEKLVARYELRDVARLAPGGYRLERAKICGIEGQPALHLVYMNGEREVSVYIRTGKGAAAAIHLVSLGSEQLAEIRTGRVEAIVATGGSTEECLEFARVAAKSL